MRYKTVLFVVVALIITGYATAQKLPIGVDFFGKLRSISSLQEKDGNLFFLLKQADLRLGKYISNLYQLKANGNAVLLTTGNDVDWFSLQGNDIILRQSRKNETTFKRLANTYGEALEWLKLPYRVQEVAFITPDYFFFTAQYRLKQAGYSNADNYRIFKELPFWSNGRGDIDGLRTVLYQYDKGNVTLLSDTLASVSELALSPDKHRLGYVLRKHSGKTYPDNELLVLNTASLDTKAWSVADSSSYGQLNFTKEGTLLFTLRRYSEENPQQNAALYQLDLTNGKAKELYDGDVYSVGNSLISDIKGGNRSKLFADKQGVYYVSTVIDHAPLVQVDYKGTKVSILTPDSIDVDEYIPYRKGFLLIASTPSHAQEIYYWDKGKKLFRLSDINTSLLDSHQVVIPQPIEFTNRNGMKLRGYVLSPAHYEEGKKYPAILDIHGGPKATYGTSFFHEMQYWANRGYAVIFTNPTGSNGRGSEFARLKGAFGDIDYDDLVRFVDTAVVKTNFIDKMRIGVTGGSYGGVMTNWIIGHTDRFRAAVSQRSISSWISFTTLSDIGYSFGYAYTGSNPWNNYEELWKRSPLAYANRVKTPTLFIHSEEDYRCPLPEGIQMYSALRYFNVPSRIVIFKGENHELSRSGKPQNRIKRLQEITQWFEQYLR